MLESMLGPHLKSNKASTSDIGISFFILGGSHFIGCLIFGHLIDQFGKPLLFSIVGNLLFCTVFVFVGPIPFIRFAKTTKITKGMMVLAGLSYSLLGLSSFKRAQQNVLKLGFENRTSTHFMISGIWLSAFSLGNFIGPTIAGVLVDKYGFRDTTLVFCILYLVGIIIDVIQVMVEIIKK